MAPRRTSTRRTRADEASSEGEEGPIQVAKQRRLTSTARREVAESSDVEPSSSRLDDDDGANGGNNVNGADGGEDHDNAIAPINVMVTRLVRLALACEYARQPLRRAEISAKVLSDFGERNFKNVFKATQEVLADKFAMTLVELPVRERMTVTQRRAAQKVERAATTSKAWVVTTILPPKYRIPSILPPSHAPIAAAESTYTALYSLIIAIIMLSGGALPEQKLGRHLRRLGVQNHTPLDRTDRVLARMVREGYLVRNVDTSSGEEIIEFHVGPRGKVEVGTRGVAGLVGEVYGYGTRVLEEEQQQQEQSEEGGGESARTATNGRGGENGADDGEEHEVQNTADTDRLIFIKKLKRSLGPDSVAAITASQAA